MDRKLHPEAAGTICLWQFQENAKNYPAWNFSASPAGARSLISIVRALQLSGGFRTIPIAPPTPAVLQVPNNRGGDAKWFAPKKWRIVAADHPEYWHFPAAPELAVLTLGSAGMDDLIAGVSSIADGEGDYCIGGANAEESLWFWWHPRTNT